MKLSKKLKDMKFLHLKEGWYPAVVSELSESITADKKTSFLNLNFILNANDMDYHITKSFITNDFRNYELQSFLEGLDIIRDDGTVDWLSILEFDFDVYITEKLKNGQRKWAISKIEPFYDDEDEDIIFEEDEFYE
jgi:hypothetical protein